MGRSAFKLDNFYTYPNSLHYRKISTVVDLFGVSFVLGN
jgi:hypothetical protein